MTEQRPPYNTLPRSEHEEQAAFVAEVLYRYANRDDFIRPLFFSTFNGAWLGGNAGARARQMQKAKEAGFLPGVADILYLQPRGEWMYLVIEMKSKGGKLSEEQKTFINAVKWEGEGLAVVCHSAEEAIETFDKYMGDGQ